MYPPGFVALEPKLAIGLRSGQMRSAVTEDRALQGCNLSAGDGPKLAGVVPCSPKLGPPLPVFWLSLYPGSPVSVQVRRRDPAGPLSSQECTRGGAKLYDTGGMAQAGGVSGKQFQAKLFERAPRFASVGGHPPEGHRSRSGGGRRRSLQFPLPARSFGPNAAFSEAVSEGRQSLPLGMINYAPKALRVIIYRGIGNGFSCDSGESRTRSVFDTPMK